MLEVSEWGWYVKSKIESISKLYRGKPYIFLELHGAIAVLCIANNISRLVIHDVCFKTNMIVINQ